MGQADLLIAGLLVAAAGLSALARRLSVPYPIVLVVGGALFGFVPGLPAVKLDPEVVLVVFLPPLLYDASIFAIFNELRANLRALTLSTVDKTGFRKKGITSVGVQRQYSGTAGKVDNCQLGVFLAYASPKGRVMIDRGAVLPERWTDGPERCRPARVPGQVQFRTKPELAPAHAGARPGRRHPAAWVTADEVYGGSPAPRPPTRNGRGGTRRAGPAATDGPGGPPAAGRAGVDHPCPAGLGAGLVQMAATPPGSGPTRPLPATTAVAAGLTRRRCTHARPLRELSADRDSLLR
jgi:hypothetical protein